MFQLTFELFSFWLFDCILTITRFAFVSALRRMSSSANIESSRRVWVRGSCECVFELLLLLLLIKCPLIAIESNLEIGKWRLSFHLSFNLKANRYMRYETEIVSNFINYIEWLCFQFLLRVLMSGLCLFFVIVIVIDIRKFHCRCILLLKTVRFRVLKRKEGSHFIS